MKYISLSREIESTSGNQQWLIKLTDGQFKLLKRELDRPLNSSIVEDLLHQFNVPQDIESEEIEVLSSAFDGNWEEVTEEYYKEALEDILPLNREKKQLIQYINSSYTDEVALVKTDKGNQIKIIMKDDKNGIYDRIRGYLQAVKDLASETYDILDDQFITKQDNLFESLGFCSKP